MILKLRELIEEIKDGIELSFEVDADASKQIIKILSGEPGRIPIKVKVKIVEED